MKLYLINMSINIGTMHSHNEHLSTKTNHARTIQLFIIID